MHLFFEIAQMMDSSANKVYDHAKFGGIFGPIKKAKAYSKIDYSDVYEKLKELEEVMTEERQKKTDHSLMPEARYNETNIPRNVSPSKEKSAFDEIEP